MNFKMNFNMNLEKDTLDEVVPTTNLQMTSLIAVMKEVGYEFSGLHYNFYKKSTYDRRVSFKTAVEFHNGLCTTLWDSDWVDDGVISQFGPIEFNLYQLHRAMAAQIVDKVKLQLKKKSKVLITQNHNVRFVVKDYWKIFLPEI